jgi:hypothetical protein
MTDSLNARWILISAGVGLVAGGVVGGIASSFSVFGWEAWGALVFLLAAAAGLVAGGVGAMRGTMVGGLVGAVPFGALFAWTGANASANGELPSDDSWGIPVWGTVTVIAAAFVAAALSALVVRARQQSAGSPG